MIDCNDLGEWRGVYPVADVHASLSAYDRIFTDETVLPDPDTGIGQISKVVNMQDGPMHHNRTVADMDTLVAGV